ncbi:MAG: amidase [Anaerolineae bacterium]|nr:amidase [Anaerolineae bacterium]
MTQTTLPFAVEEATVADLQAAMSSGALTAVQLVEALLQRIDALDRHGPTLNSVIELNPDAMAIATALDVERRAGRVRGPLHGIPFMVKDNIDSADKMLTTAGSLAMTTSMPAQDATVVRQLREAGAILLGKTNLSEWANIRSTQSVSGWSGRGGQTRNPYKLDHNPCGSSSGSGVAVSAGFVPVALGTETDGSIVCPAHINGIVGIKPTVGLTSRAGVIPISHSQDTVGPMARTVADAAAFLGVLTGVDPRDAATGASAGWSAADYTQFLDPDALRGARIGVPRTVYFGYDEDADAIAKAALAVLRAAGAEIVDPVTLPSAEEIRENKAELQVLLYELKTDLAAYLATRVPHPDHLDAVIPRSLADLIAYNIAHADREMPHFGQELFEQAVVKGPLSDPAYLKASADARRMGREEGVDAVLDAYKLDALVAPTGGPAWRTDYEAGDAYGGGSSTHAAIAGYPLITVPAGFADGLPVGLTFMGRAYSESTLIGLAYAFEQLTQARRKPEFYL